MTDAERGERKRWQKEGVVFLIYEEGRVLLEERTRPDSGHYGYIIIPGGNVERGETKEEAFLREVEEELGIKPTSYRHLDSFENMTLSRNHYLLHAFLVTDFDGEVVNREPERCNMIWVPLKEAESLLRLGSSRLVLFKAKPVISAAGWKMD